MSEYPVSIGDSIVCDMTFPQSPCGPLYTPDFIGAMRERLALGVTYTSITIASDELTIDGAMRWLGEARAHVADNPDLYVMVERVADIERAKAEGKAAINFHFQGTNALLGDLGLVEVYYKLGVKHMLMAYNSRNLVGDGCHEESDVGLSRYGKALVAEMNRVGMIVDVSHTGYRSSMDAIELSTKPVIFSHSNAKALWGHQRNITDDQARACAATGGVIGVNGVGLFLTEARFDNSPETIARHLDYLANLVGPQHVGFGLDSVHDIPHFLSNFAKTGKERKYPVGGYLTSSKPAFAGPDVIPKVLQVLAKMGWSETDLKAVMGGNWLRVMSQVWG